MSRLFQACFFFSSFKSNHYALRKQWVSCLLFPVHLIILPSVLCRCQLLHAFQKCMYGHEVVKQVIPWERLFPFSCFSVQWIPWRGDAAQEWGQAEKLWRCWLLFRDCKSTWPCRLLPFLMALLQASMLWDGLLSCHVSGFLIASLLCASPPLWSKVSGWNRNAIFAPSRSFLAPLPSLFFFSLLPLWLFLAFCFGHLFRPAAGHLATTERYHPYQRRQQTRALSWLVRRRLSLLQPTFVCCLTAWLALTTWLTLNVGQLLLANALCRAYLALISGY